MKRECLDCPLQLECGLAIHKLQGQTVQAISAEPVEIEAIIRELEGKEDLTPEDALAFLLAQGGLKIVLGRQDGQNSQAALVNAVRFYAKNASERCRLPKTKKRFIFWGRKIIHCSGARMLPYGDSD